MPPEPRPVRQQSDAEATREVPTVPESPQPEPENPTTTSSARPAWVKAAAITGGVVGVLAIGYGIDLAVSSGSMPRGTAVAGIEIGGASREEAHERLVAGLSNRVDEPVAVRAGDVETQIVPADAGLGFDWEATLDHAEAQPLNPFVRVASFFTTTDSPVVPQRDDTALFGAIDGLRNDVDRAPREGGVVFEGATPVAVTPEPGQNLDGQAAADEFALQWPYGETVELPVDTVPVTVTQDAVDRAMNEVAIPATSADLVVTGRDDVAATLPRDAVGAVLSFAPTESGDLEPRFDAEAATGILAPQLAPTEVQPEDARIRLSGGTPTITPSVEGVLVNWEETLEQLPEMMTDTHTGEAVYETKEPELTTERAESLGVNEQVSTFSTGGFSAASGTNIRLAANAINGALVMPGETFSLNGHTGPRGTAQGYVESGIINNGRPDNAVGGGVSQVATTLYNASYFAGMEDVAHTEHSYYISRYPEAREATVFEGAIDLQFRNPFDTAVLIAASADSSTLTVSFYGTDHVEVESVTGSRSNPTQPNTVRLPAGEACSPSSGAPGFTSSDTRIIRDAASGREISRDTRTVRYDPQPIVVCGDQGDDSADDDSAGDDE
ncbi:hypothetical protein DW322_07090 [Rhodococcus rhodnii]|uniref:YoaR-like putative peptidoglycan binding domain-containing protein n=3 Tax=Rhodococcus rhodnii TaxID=38312 RepID=R7WN44_9NOCA|nr:hypothetical protein Rrhod_1938 [Rhodococcus rhodnii LMG 5362]TXG92495.1 hypothetical protein DW322_07090 [Rhodococcus rhodnii]